MMATPTSGTPHVGPSELAVPDARPPRRSTDGRARSGWRRALGADVRLNQDMLIGEALLGALILALGYFSAADPVGLALIWAVLGWYRYGRGDSSERLVLTATLGVSRGDRVRGRIALITIESAALLGVWLMARVTALLLGTRQGLSAFWDEHPVVELVGDALSLALVLLLVALMVGRACLLRRPGKSMGPLSLATGLGAWILATVAEQALTAWATGPGGADHPVTDGQLVLLPLPMAALVALAVLLLVRRVRAWIRALDEGGSAATP